MNIYFSNKYNNYKNIKTIMKTVEILSTLKDSKNISEIPLLSNENKYLK